MSVIRNQLQVVLLRLGSIFAILGALSVVAGIFTFLILGRLDRAVVVLLALGAGLLVYALLEQPERTAQTLSSRGVRYGSNTVVMSLAFIGILALINVLSNRYDQRLDLTQNHLYTLSPLSIQVVHELKQPVQVYAFYKQGQTGQAELEDLLKLYASQSNGKITYQFDDPDLKPGLARQYNIQTAPSVVLVSGNKQQILTGFDEGAITSGLLKLTRDKPQVAYYLTGHGELDFASTAANGASTVKDALQADNYAVKSLNLAASGKVPADAAVLIVAAPTSPLLPQEVTALEQYLDNGGKALFLTDKRERAILEPIAERYGVQIGNGVVVDTAQNLNYDPLTPVISPDHLQSSPITKDLPMLVLPAATSVSPLKNAPKDLQIQPLAQTTAQSWLETDAKVVHYDPGVDPQGPLTVAVSVSKLPATGAKAASSGMRAVFIGDVIAATNNAVQVPGDKYLVTNSVNWLTANEDLIQIEAKTPTNRTMVLSSTQLNLLLFGSTLILPLAVLAVGGVIWWNRR